MCGAVVVGSVVGRDWGKDCGVDGVVGNGRGGKVGVCCCCCCVLGMTEEKREGAMGVWCGAAADGGRKGCVELVDNMKCILLMRIKSRLPKDR